VPLNDGDGAEKETKLLLNSLMCNDEREKGNNKYEKNGKNWLGRKRERERF
jgi:hypothetical protein